MKIKICLLLLLMTNICFAKNYLDENLKKIKWNDIEVVWIEDDSLPTYDILFYFKEGALGETKSNAGEVELMFSQLTSGTNRYSQKEILENLEFFSTNYDSHVTHEYSTFSVSGLVKDLVPSMKMICHMFDDAKFPDVELKRMKKRIESGIKTMVTNHSQLANHVFRIESMKGSGFELPTTGTLASIKKIESKDLKKRLDYFNKNVFKRIYIRGPSAVTDLKNIIVNDCRWAQGELRKDVPTQNNEGKLSQNIILIPVPNANQAQIRIGKFINSSEISFIKSDLKTFTAKYMGGGFTSQLIQSLRVGKGLTYSASAYASEQKNYGRAGISTFTKNESLVEMLKAIDEVVQKNETTINSEELARAKRSAKGQYLLSLESTSDFLSNLLFFDHIGRNYEDIYKFTNNIEKLNSNDLKLMVAELFNMKKQTILIVGDKSLKKILEKEGHKVSVRKIKDYL